ncbi:hypothetical protein [Amycolatopsis magusensis]|uniref:Phospholipase A2 n=1 Tax=Amycolatopsis magusensis TaxID=882444 RepID=A0ABS4PQL0_9PSEU|nr:hypothetical protein [Amycolatopsis magusensis]MBP2181707.1 hypothetical protein [Amycolatopsis magusensis]MDI5981116.1 hypothetical protein [Amycolatopsis magusensis]UJW32095.1 phospholipase [Saccharothrix sp. AJ9571]
MNGKLRRFAVVLACAAGGLGMAAGSAQAASFVPVPSGYVYDTSRGAWHDYCTWSPDKPVVPPWGQVDFRGPCAHHDMCEEAGGANTLRCDRLFFDKMHQQCEYTFGTGPARGPCDFIADTYYNVVRNTGDPA